MAIFTRWGDEIELVSYHGKHKPKGFDTPLMLVGTRHKDGGETRYAFSFTLKADGGINEIEEVIATLPEITLAGKELKAAIKEAE